jgi:hypothetical protein
MRAQAKQQAGIPVRVDVTPERVRVEIADEEGGDGAPHVGAYARRILERLADRWGVENDGHAAIWFELDRARQVTASGSAPGRPT